MFDDRRLSREVRKVGRSPLAVLIRSQIADKVTHGDMKSLIKGFCGIRVCDINVAFLIKTAHPFVSADSVLLMQKITINC
jgi:hypothetical protein